MTKEKQCIVADCDRPIKARGLCSRDLTRWNVGTLGIEALPAMSPAEAGSRGGKVSSRNRKEIAAKSA